MTEANMVLVVLVPLMWLISVNNINDCMREVWTARKM